MLRFLPFLLTLPALAGEYAVLSSGLRLHIDRHEQTGDTVKLYGKGGITELSASNIVEFEIEEEVVATPPPPPAPEQVPATLPAPPAQDTRAMLRSAALRAGLPPAFVESVAKIESAFNPRAVSPKGAIGVMQLMPQTAKALQADPTNPQENIDAGTRLLRELLIKYNGDVVKALAAYNAGSGAVDRYHGLPPYSETQWYVHKVVREYQNLSDSTKN